MLEKIDLIEVSPRDGFQYLNKFIPTLDKIRFINSLFESGVKKVQISSFVKLYQLKDALEVSKHFLNTEYRNDCLVLTLNKEGVKRAVEVGNKNISFVISTCENHNNKNSNMTINDSFKDLQNSLNKYRNINFRLDIAKAFGNSITDKELIEFINRARNIGVKEFVLADTDGLVKTKDFKRRLRYIKNVFNIKNFTLHLHDALGLSYDNIRISRKMGFYKYESSLLGLGGCPFIEKAKGNVKTEKLIELFDTGIDNNKIKKSKSILKEICI